MKKKHAEKLREDVRKETLNEVMKIIDEHILADDYMGIDTKQSLKELKVKLLT